MNQVYLDTARLLTQAAPLVFAGGIFALKGGTALTLFFRDVERLSIDLDLVFVDHGLSRDEALATINAAIREAASRLEARGFQAHVTKADDVGETKLFVRRGTLEIKAEVDFAMWGARPSGADCLSLKNGTSVKVVAELCDIFADGSAFCVCPSGGGSRPSCRRRLGGVEPRGGAGRNPPVSKCEQTALIRTSWSPLTRVPSRVK